MKQFEQIVESVAIQILGGGIRDGLDPIESLGGSGTVRVDQNSLRVAAQGRGHRASDPGEVRTPTQYEIVV